MELPGYCTTYVTESLQSVYVLFFINARAWNRYVAAGVRPAALTTRFPDLRIIVGRWGLRAAEARARRQLEAAGADSVGVTLIETREHLQRVHSLEPPTLRPPVEAEPALRS